VTDTEQPTVYLSNKRNSTLFSTCCRVAISEETACPWCKRVILPVTKDARWEHARHVARILTGYGVRQ